MPMIWPQVLVRPEKEEEKIMKQASTQHTSNYIACISEPVSSRPSRQTPAVGAL